MCENAPCSKACPYHIDPGKLVRYVYFDNVKGAANKLPELPCSHCDAPCEKNCIQVKRKRNVEIKKTLIQLSEVQSHLDKVDISSVDLSSEIYGIKLENPFLLSSSVVASNYEMCAKAFEAGWAGAAFKTICTFCQHEVSPRFSALKNRNSDFYGFKNVEQLSANSVDEDMQILSKLKKNYPCKVLVAFIMGQNEEEWEELKAGEMPWSLWHWEQGVYRLLPLLCNMVIGLLRICSKEHGII